MIFGGGSITSTNRECVLISNCSRESLFTCGDLRTVNFLILRGSETGPETCASAVHKACQTFVVSSAGT